MDNPILPNATQAFPHWYCYALVDPRSGETFYIGKGKGRRAWQHEASVRRNAAGCNRGKVRRIEGIIASGQSVEVRILAVFGVEDDAYDFERRAIGLYRSQLVNILGGSHKPESARDRATRDARDLLRRVIPEECWRQLRPRTHRDIEIYRFVAAGLSELAQ